VLCEHKKRLNEKDSHTCTKKKPYWKLTGSEFHLVETFGTRDPTLACVTKHLIFRSMLKKLINGL